MLADRGGNAHMPGMSLEPDPQSTPTGEERFDSWKEIATYLKKTVRTVQRWERLKGLPVHRHGHGKSGSIYAFKANIDLWLKYEPEGDRKDIRSVVVLPLRNLSGDPEQEYFADGMTES